MTGFDPSHIVDDEVFYDVEAMSLDEVSAFIEEVNAGCRPGQDGTPCLAQATFDTVDHEATALCPGAYEGAAGESAAQVLWKVSQACQISPRVLLVLIHKEQGLLTASGELLTASDYTVAAGYGCPDYGTCDPRYAGFEEQLYGAASQFQRYRQDPASYGVVAGVPTVLSYSPDPACGSAPLTVLNQATAGLYDYTPYQPNAAAGSGGDRCTSWGNWNFYGYYRYLFGDPTPSTTE